MTRILLFALTIPACAGLQSCSPEAVQAQQDQLNESYDRMQQNRAIRRDARQERTDMWFDRHMGKTTY